MATPIDLLDHSTVMSYGGVVDASTAEGHLDEATDWCGATAALLTADVARTRSVRRPSIEMTRPRAAPLRRGTQWRWGTRGRVGAYTLPEL